MKIRPLKIEDLNAITEIHVERFPNHRSTMLGRPFLRKMYSWFIINHPELALGAINNDQLVGFAVGSIGGYGRQVFRYALPEILWGVIRHSKLIFNRSTYRLWESFIRAFTPNLGEKKTTEPGPPKALESRFASFAVLESAKGMGLALIIALETAAKRRGAGFMALSVRKENVSLQRVYEMLGWHRDHETTGFVSYVKHFAPPRN